MRHYALLGEQVDDDVRASIGSSQYSPFSPVMVATYTKGIEESKATWADARTVMECVFAVGRSRGDSDYLHLTAYAKAVQRCRGRLFSSVAAIAEAR